MSNVASSFRVDSRGQARLLRFAPDHKYVPARGRSARLVVPEGELELPDLPASFDRLLLRLPLMTAGAIKEAVAIGADCLDALRVLADLCVLEDCVVDETGQPVLVARRPTLKAHQRPCRGPLRLHEHAFLRPGFPGWILLRADVPTSIRIDASVADLRQFATAVHTEQLGAVGNVLLDEGFLVANGISDESSLEFHDAVFHSVSALGDTTEGGYGARRRPRLVPSMIRGSSDQCPGTHATVGLEVSAALRTPPLHEVLAVRRSCRNFTADPIPLASVSELLALALRTQARHPQAPGECVLHAYPSAGARDEITTVVASAYPRATLSLYLHGEHRLLPLDATTDSAREVIQVLCRPCGIVDPLPALGLVFAADYHRIASKYEAIAYANILRNVGAIYQTVSLSAAAIGLGSCAVGGGWAHLERHTLADLLDGRLIVGGMVVGNPEAAC